MKTYLIATFLIIYPMISRADEVTQRDLATISVESQRLTPFHDDYLPLPQKVNEVGETKLNIFQTLSINEFTKVGPHLTWASMPNSEAYIEYYLNVPIAGIYSFLASYSSLKQSGVSVYINGGLQGELHFQALESWDDYYDISEAIPLRLPQGVIVLRIETNSPNAFSLQELALNRQE